MPTSQQKRAGRELRYTLTLLLRGARRPMSVQEMARALHESGRPLQSRSGKVISDALRWEIARGRVVKVRRSTYATRPFPDSTARWMRSQLNG